jgi:uncharacterized protein (TIGR02145 family)
MKSNLDVSFFRNGDTIPQAKTKKEWQIAAIEKKPAWCYYENNPEYGNKYGKLYNYYAVNDPRELAPEGWHIPSNSEWDNVREFISNNKFDFKNTSDGFLKTKLGGYRNAEGNFCCNNNFEAWWSNTPAIKDLIWIRYIGYHFSQVDIGDDYKSYGFAVRCILNSNTKQKKQNVFLIGEQKWMTHNLDVPCFSNGDTIKQVKSAKEWLKACESGEPAWCYYNNDSAYANTHGKLYNWYTVIDPRKLAPNGFHIPFDEEWAELEKFTNNNNWQVKGIQYFINSSSGLRFVKTAEFRGMGVYSSWWGDNSKDTSKICYRDLSCRTDKLYSYYYPKGCGVYVRCIKD